MMTAPMSVAMVMMAAMHRLRICAGREMSRVQFPEQSHKIWQALASDDDMGRAEPALGLTEMLVPGPRL